VEACGAEGLCVKATTGADRWLGTECSEGQTRDTKRSAGTREAFMCRKPGTKSRPAEVRAFIVALKPGNAGGAKGRRKVGVG
jgi:hypothetical protein